MGSNRGSFMEPQFLLRGIQVQGDVKRLDAGYLVAYDDTDEFFAQVNYIFSNYEEALKKTNKTKNILLTISQWKRE